MELVKCDSCKTDFRPTSDQLNFILTSKEKGMTFTMLECTNCGLSFPFNPSALGESDNSSDIPIRTPLSGVHGYVSYVGSVEENFYGCGETGAIWRNEGNLFRDIDLIIKKYPHRASCYIKTKNGWIANSEEPENMDELIDQEELEGLVGFDRD
tara:strand:- start:2289 stop:2750 length:462 start_codon:yes stop_codon:yes gene_type:complete